MPRYIDATLLKAEFAGNFIDTSYSPEFIKAIIDGQPTADVVPVVYGRWIDKGEYAVCTECGGRSGTQYNGVEPIPLMTQFCPHCGTKMDRKEAEAKMKGGEKE